MIEDDSGKWAEADARYVELKDPADHRCFNCGCWVFKDDNFCKYCGMEYP